MDEPREEQLDEEELEKQDGEPLPDREVMSTVNIGGPLGGAVPFDPGTGYTLPVEPPATE
jgi:hypothetical protein